MLESIPKLGPEKKETFPTLEPALNKKIFRLTTSPAIIAVMLERTKPVSASAGIG